ncbi:Phenylacetic acid catabolic protein [Streptomyces fuscichromogenes]|uniref:Phenylacetic acid catabolic protein n=1 Tax=Streptomyces fuscichromogenes TaxID=1324013 RepID=UPI003821795B
MPQVPTDDDVYEVFAQTGTGSALSHVGSLVAPRRDAAWHLAKETYGRRDDLSRLWVVRRGDLIVSTADDRGLLAAKTRMPHRQPGFPTTRRRDRSAAPEDVGAATLTAAARERPGGSLPERDDTHGVAGRALDGLWLALADDLFVLGNRLGERIVDYIDLEESLAVGSIGQEALAHAETVLALHGFDGPAADAHFFERPREQWQVSGVIGRLGDWPSTVACGLVIAAAVTVLAEEHAAHEPAIAAVRDEQRVHLDHWRRWARALAAWPETSEEFARAYAEVTRSAGDLFGAGPRDVPADAPPGPSAAAAELHGRLATLILDSGGPGSHLPDLPVPRAAGSGGSVLADCLAHGRVVREHYAPEVFL